MEKPGVSVYTYIKRNDKFLFFAWYLLIIIVSSIPHLPTPKIKAFDSTVRLDYFIHFLEYFILSFLFMLWRISKNSKPKFMMLLLYGVIGMGAAFLGEVYQKLIPGRTFNLVDGIYNCLGFTAGILFICLVKKAVRSGNQELRNQALA